MCYRPKKGAMVQGADFALKEELVHLITFLPSQEFINKVVNSRAKSHLKSWLHGEGRWSGVSLQGCGSAPHQPGVVMKTRLRSSTRLPRQNYRGADAATSLAVLYVLQLPPLVEGSAILSEDDVEVI